MISSLQKIRIPALALLAIVFLSPIYAQRFQFYDEQTTYQELTGGPLDSENPDVQPVIEWANRILVDFFMDRNLITDAEIKTVLDKFVESGDIIEFTDAYVEENRIIIEALTALMEPEIQSEEQITALYEKWRGEYPDYDFYGLPFWKNAKNNFSSIDELELPPLTYEDYFGRQKSWIRNLILRRRIAADYITRKSLSVSDRDRELITQTFQNREPEEIEQILKICLLEMAWDQWREERIVSDMLHIGQDLRYKKALTDKLFNSLENRKLLDYVAQGQSPY